MNEQIFNYVHHLPLDSSGCQQVSPTAWYSILNDTEATNHELGSYYKYGIFGQSIMVNRSM